MIGKKDPNGLIACFGTWKDLVDGTHVQKIYKAWQGDKFCIDGIGTGLGPVGRLIAGMFGFGWRGQIRKALSEIDQRPDNINWSIVGHSRGAMTALRLADRLRRDKAKVPNLILLDPVGSFGVNALIKTCIPSWIRRKWNIENEQPVPDNVDNTWAIYAYDEERPHFRPTYLIRSRDNQKCLRCWLKGSHQDIGGYGDETTANNVGGLISYMCSDDFGDSMVWPSEWQTYNWSHFTTKPIEYTVGQISGLKRYMPFGSLEVVVDRDVGFRSQANSDRTITQRQLLLLNGLLKTR